jgi:hypothetical protein
VRRALVGAIAAIAQRDLPANKWPALLPFLQQCSLSPLASHRTAAMDLLKALTEHVGTELEAHVAELQTVFVRGLADVDEAVRRASLEAISGFFGTAPALLLYLCSTAGFLQPSSRDRCCGWSSFCCF